VDVYDHEGPRQTCPLAKKHTLNITLHYSSAHTHTHTHTHFLLLKNHPKLYHNTLATNEIRVHAIKKKKKKEKKIKSNI